MDWIIFVNENMHDAGVRVSTDPTPDCGWERIWKAGFASREEAISSQEYKEAKEYVRGRLLP